MKRKAAAAMFLAAFGGWGTMDAEAGKFMSNAFAQPSSNGVNVGVRSYAEAPGYVGAWGQPVPAAYAAQSKEPSGAEYARMTMAGKLPPELLQQMNFNAGGLPGAPPGGPMCGPGGCPPGMGGPGGPMVSPNLPVGAVAGVGMLTGQQAPMGVQRTSIRFVGPATMKISWYAPKPDGKAAFTPQYLEAPARYNFLQASIYRLKLNDIPNRSGVELYPTLEVLPATQKTATFLAHSAVPVSFTEEDFEQVAAGNFVVKVIYLPDPQFQDLAATGPDEVVSSRLEPGVDPIGEARRRGSILAVVRLGNIDLEAPNTPAMDAPDPAAMRFDPRMMGGPGMGGPGMMPPGMMPPGMMPPGMMPPGMKPVDGPVGGTPTLSPPPGATGPMIGKAPAKKATSSGIVPVGFFGGK